MSDLHKPTPADKWMEFRPSLARMQHFKTIKYNAKSIIQEVIQKSDEMFIDDSIESINNQTELWGKAFQQIISFYSVFDIENTIKFFTDTFYNNEKTEQNEAMSTIKAFVESLEAFKNNFLSNDKIVGIPDITSIGFYLGSLSKYLDQLAQTNKYPDIRFHTNRLYNFVNEAGQFVCIHQEAIAMNRFFQEYQSSIFKKRYMGHKDYSIEKFGELFDKFVSMFPKNEGRLRSEINKVSPTLGEWEYRKQ